MPGMVVHNLVAPEKLLNLVIAELSIILLPHLLARSTHFRDSFVFPEHFIILALLNQSLILRFAMQIRLLLSFASGWSCASLTCWPRRLVISVLIYERLRCGLFVEAFVLLLLPRIVL
jgi:hypothetical protein